MKKRNETLEEAFAKGEQIKLKKARKNLGAFSKEIELASKLKTMTENYDKSQQERLLFATESRIMKERNDRLSSHLRVIARLLYVIQETIREQQSLK